MTICGAAGEAGDASAPAGPEDMREDPMEKCKMGRISERLIRT